VCKDHEKYCDQGTKILSQQTLGCNHSDKDKPLEQQPPGSIRNDKKPMKQKKKRGSEHTLNVGPIE
jgi:hypothetical protein